MNRIWKITGFMTAHSPKTVWNFVYCVCVNTYSLLKSHSKGNPHNILHWSSWLVYEWFSVLFQFVSLHSFLGFRTISILLFVLVDIFKTNHAKSIVFVIFPRYLVLVQTQGTKPGQVLKLENRNMFLFLTTTWPKFCSMPFPFVQALRRCHIFSGELLHSSLLLLGMPNGMVQIWLVSELKTIWNGFKLPIHQWLVSHHSNCYWS